MDTVMKRTPLNPRQFRGMKNWIGVDPGPLAGQVKEFLSEGDRRRSIYDPCRLVRPVKKSC
jgi:hypothetical protein